MEQRKVLSVIDSNSRRRAALTHGLSDCGIHVEPFEHIEEILYRWPRSGVILVEDADDNIRHLLFEMTEHGKWLPLVALAERPVTGSVVRAILDGAIDYIEWPCEAAEMLAVLGTAETAGTAIGHLKLREARARSRLQRLTRREREVLAGVADGLSNRRIGEQLAISPRTVEIHRANMLTKIGAQHTSEAIRVAIEASLVG